MNYTSFFDEMEKIALQRIAKGAGAAKRMLSVVRDTSAQMAPVASDAHPITVKRIYRAYTPHRNTPDEPIRERLKNYRAWKKSEDGALPEIRGGKVTGSDSGARYVRSNEPMPLESGGTAEGFRAAKRRLGAPIPRRILIPGQTKSTRRGMWAHSKGESDRMSFYANNAAEVRGGTPAVASFTVPRKHTVVQKGGSGTERIVPEGVTRRGGLPDARVKLTGDKASSRRKQEYGRHPLSVAETQKKGPSSKRHHDTYERARKQLDVEMAKNVPHHKKVRSWHLGLGHEAPMRG